MGTLWGGSGGTEEGEGAGCDRHLHVEAAALGVQPVAQHGGGQELVVLDAVGLQADGGTSWGQWGGRGVMSIHPSRVPTVTWEWGH